MAEGTLLKAGDREDRRGTPVEIGQRLRDPLPVPQRADDRAVADVPAHPSLGVGQSRKHHAVAIKEGDPGPGHQLDPREQLRKPAQVERAEDQGLQLGLSRRSQRNPARVTAYR